jgi:GH35 family endo-1,4-beta-xylanase
MRAKFELRLRHAGLVVADNDMKWQALNPRDA